MKYYAGLDVAMKNTSVCIVDETGKIVHESSVKPTLILWPMQSKKQLKNRAGWLESGSLGHYLARGLKKGLYLQCVWTQEN